MTGWKTSQTHQRRSDGNVQGLGEREQFVGAAGVNDAATDVEHWTLGGEHALERPLDLELIGAQRWIVAGQAKLGWIDECSLFRGDIFRNVDEHRAGASGAREVKG